MITFIRSVVAMPGKTFEYLNVAMEMVSVVKRVTGVESKLATAVGGDPSTIGYVGQFGSLADFETAMTKLMADADYRGLIKKSEHLLVPASIRDQIWRHL
jgi:hypothetical protein